ncbi:MAG: SCO family protein [Ardenticatenia bacterium]|nr:MAG: SCO family protein [Ardenticatenia bacterium]
MTATTITPSQVEWHQRPLVRWLLLGGAVLLAAAVAFALFQPITVVPRIAPSPAFVLTDQNGETLTSEDLRGGLTLITITYADCQPPCPQTDTLMRSIQEALPTIEEPVVPMHLLSISIDPRDTPERLRAYAERVGADGETWRIATGDPVQLKYALGDGFRIYYEVRDNGEIVFEPTYVLVDSIGLIRGIYQYETAQADIIRRDIQLIQDEIRNSKGAAKLVYETAHLFLCYPTY